MKRCYWLIVIFLFINFSEGFSQKTYSSMYRFDFSKNDNIHFYPKILNKKEKEAQQDKSLFYRKLFKESLISIRKEGLNITINPLVNFSAGHSDLKKKSLFINTRGIGVKGSISENIVFNTSFYETQLSTPIWIDNYYKKTNVLPGKTLPKPFKEGSYDVGAVYGTVAFLKNIKNWKLLFQIGYDEFFIGNGYRSLLLSDHSLPYFHGHLQVNYKNITFHHITASLQNPNFKNFLHLENPISKKPYEKKTLTIHYINWQPISGFSIGFFENTIFKIPTESRNHHFSMTYINPIPFVHPLMYGLNEEQNVAVGLDANYNINRHFSIYSQLLFDDLKKDYTAFQVSTKYTSSHIKCRLEYNQIGKYTYDFHDMRQSSTHYNGYLAHPLGNNCNEWVMQAGYKINRLEIEGKVNLISSKNTDNKKINRNFYNGTIAYVFNPETRLQIFGNVMYFDNDNLSHEWYLNVGIKTQLRNEYWDF